LRLSWTIADLKGVTVPTINELDAALNLRSNAERVA
jgi:predicted ATPase with chaperone activity